MNEHKIGEIVIYGEDGNIEHAYRPDGKAFKLHPEDKTRTIADLVEVIEKERKAGQNRCTSCGCYVSKEEANYPLFAGINCPVCWKKHLKKADEERRRGHVCRMCRKPYSFCCC